MALIDLDKFVASFITEMKECSQMRNFSIPRCIKKALDDQGLEYKDGEIVKSQRIVSAEAKENGYGESEDEKVINEIINTIKGNHPTHSSKEIQKMVDWLKSLKQRHTWKPSKEQMDAMQMAVSYFGYSWTSKEQKLLESLYKDLKKL